MDAIVATVPLSTTMDNQITWLRQWSKNRAKNASSITRNLKEEPIVLTRPEIEMERSFEIPKNETLK